MTETRGCYRLSNKAKSLPYYFWRCIIMGFVERYVRERSERDPEFKRIYEETREKEVEAIILVEEDESITLSARSLGIVVNGKDWEDAFYSLAELLKEYAEMYMERFDLYFNSPNRKNHLKQVEAILECNSTEEIIYLIRPIKDI